jgi:protein-tyrosine-phosphatase
MAQSILFVCNLNAVRSVLAEYMTNRWYEGAIIAQSCGVIAGSPDGYAASVALEHDVDITEHESRYLSDLDVSGFDQIISFSQDAANEVARELDRLHLSEKIPTAQWEVTDFAGIANSREERLAVYRLVFADIEKHILGHFGAKKG